MRRLFLFLGAFGCIINMWTIGNHAVFVVVVLLKL